MVDKETTEGSGRMPFISMVSTGRNSNVIWFKSNVLEKRVIVLSDFFD